MVLNLARKVKLAIFDNDLKATIGKYELSEDGIKIRVQSGGEAHWMPFFDNDSYIEMPKPWYKGGKWERLYFVKKKAKKCVNFQTDPPTVYGPDEEQIKKAVAATIVHKLGESEPPFPIWMFYLMLLLVLGIAARVFGVLV